MRRTLKSTIMLSGGSLLAILTGLVTGKLSALWLGPRGVGLLGDFRSTMVLAGLILGFGMATAITRLGSQALACNDELTFSALVWAAFASVILLVTLSAGVLILWGARIAAVLYGDHAFTAPAITWLLLSVLGNLLAGLESGILRARLSYIKTLAGASIFNVSLTFAFSMVGLATHNVNGMLPVFAASSFAHAITLGILIGRHKLIHHRRLSGHEIFKGLKRLYQFGGPYTLSMMVGNGVQSILPVLVLHWIGARNLGFYMAAITISTQYMGFLTNSMGQDYLPRLSAETEPARIEEIIMQELSIILLIILPLVTLVMMLAPAVIPLVYTPSFKETVSLLQWMVAADILRFGSWSFTYAVLAKASGRYYLLLELIGGISTLLFSWTGMLIGGLNGLGWAYVIIYLTLAIASLIVGFHTLPLHWQNFPKETIAISVATVIVMRILTLWPSSPVIIGAMALLVSGIVFRSYRHLSRGWNVGIPANSTTP